MSPRTIALVAALCVAILAVTTTSALGAISFHREWTLAGHAGSEAGVAVDRAGGTVYVADPYFGATGRILVYDPAGTLLRVLDKASGVDVERPLGLAVDSAGNLHVLEGDRNRVLVLTPTGTPVRVVAPTGNDAFDDLTAGIAVDAADNLYVANTRASRIDVFDASGGPVRKVGLGGFFVTDVAVDAAGNTYGLVIFGTAGCEAAVQVNDPAGNQIARWNATQPPLFGCARFGIAIDPRTSEVLVASQGGSKPGIRRYTPAGALVGAALLGNGTPGDTIQAVGLAVDKSGAIYTRDTRLRRLLRFADLPPAPILQNTIPSPQTIRSGPATVVAPGKISLRSLKRSRCVRTLVLSTKPARVRVRIFSGIRSIRLFGQKLVVFRAAGRKVACIPVPFRAKTFDARTRLRIAVGVALGSVLRPGAPPPARPVTRPISLIP
jgi:hypothetical protein